MKCHWCGTPDPASPVELCLRCLLHLPSLTSAAYTRGEITTRQAIDIIRERSASVKTLRGGRHSR